MNRRESFMNSVRVSPNIHNGLAPKNNNVPNKIKNIKKPSIVTSKVTSNKKYSGNIKTKIAAGLLAIGTLVGTGIGANMHEKSLNEQYSKDIQSDIATKITEKYYKDSLNVKNEDFTLDENGLNISFTYEVPEIFDVLSNSNIDELLNSYISNPTDELLQTLQEREDEIAKLNLDLLKASFADASNNSINDIKIYTIFKHADSREGEDIMNGSGNYRGHTLSITVPNQGTAEAFEYRDNGKFSSNFETIPKELFDLISEVNLQVKAPDSSYFKNKKDSTIQRNIDMYKEIKLILANEYNLTIQDGKVFLVKDGKIHSYSKNIFGNTEIKEIEEEQER